MEISYTAKRLTVLWCCFCFKLLIGQSNVTWHMDGSVTVVGEKEFTYRSSNTNFDSNVLLDPQNILMVHNPDLHGGIKVSGISFEDYTEFSPYGIPITDGVTLRVSYEADDNALIYGTFANFNTTDFFEGYWLAEDNIFFSNVNSNKIKRLYKNNMPLKDIIENDNDIQSYNFPLYSLKSQVPIKITVNVKNATLHEFKIPGVGTFTPEELFYTDNIKDIIENPLNYNYAIVAAHRGYWSEPGVPENTIEAFNRAFDIGCDLIEIDVRLTNDTVPVACHDDYIFKLYDVTQLASTKGKDNNQLKIGDISATEFVSLTPNDRFGIPVEGNHPNTIEEVMEAFPNKLISLDLKDTGDNWDLAFKKCIDLAKIKGVLHNLVIKGKPKMSYIEASALLDNNAVDFSDFYFSPVMYGLYDSNGNPIIPETKYLGWKDYVSSPENEIHLVETHFKVNTDPLLVEGYPQFFHNNNVRVGIYNFYADDPNGVSVVEAPSHEDDYGVVNIRSYTPYINYSFSKQPDKLTDNRGNLDWCMEVASPDYFIYDRPDILISWLEALGLRNAEPKN